ncbi:MAG: RIP metalloprotease RseP [Parcubacteria group bacterium]
MSVIIFAIILSVLVIVHELGHFLIAKYFGVRVDEFGLGYPPRAIKLFTWRGTVFTLNWVPFGGFVKIFGENPEESGNESLVENPPNDNFQKKNRGIQASVLSAGVIFNFFFAGLLLSLGLMVGTPTSVQSEIPFAVENHRLVITSVLADSPAQLAGLKAGDTILSLSNSEVEYVPSFEDSIISLGETRDFIASSEEPVTFNISRGGEIVSQEVSPEEGISSEGMAVGISMDVIGTLQLPPHQAIWYGMRNTVEVTILTAGAIGTFLFEAITGRADLSTVAGPVGIVGIVGDVRDLGVSYLITFTALISINLAIINLLPIPALDGGRLLFVIIEAIGRRPIPPKVFNAVNGIGFLLLILLMVIITIQDVRNIF